MTFINTHTSQNFLQIRNHNCTRQIKQVSENSQRPAPGTLLIQDTFQRTSCDQKQHGDVVEFAARDQGFQGGIQRYERPKHGVAEESQLVDSINTDNLSKQDALAKLSDYAVARQLNLLNGNTAAIKKHTALAPQNVVLNLSEGASKASIVKALYNGTATAWTSDDPKKRDGAKALLLNMCEAFDLDPKHLQSKNPEESGPARKKLQQSLIDHVSSSIDNDSRFGTAKREWQSAVEAFESGNNSVVVAAGNEAGVAHALQKDNGDQPLKLPTDFLDNPLANSAVTTVGASFNPTHLAAYSNRTPEVDIHAAGTLDLGHGYGQDFGTSYSTPRVAAVMTQLHKDNPTLSSAQVENLMMQRLSYQVSTPQGPADVLTQGSSFEHLKELY